MRATTRGDIRPEDLRGKACAQYIRESTRDQGEGFGPDMQREANRTFAQRYGLADTGRVYEEYVSAKSVQGRSAFMQALDDMKRGAFQVLLVGWTHRFARSTEDAARVKREIAETGGILVYSALGMISGQRSNRLGEKVMHVLDEEYRENLADLVAAGLHAKFEAEGANGNPPLGTKHLYVRRDGSLADGPERHTHAVRVLDEADLPLMRTLFSRYLALGSYRRTAASLNQQGRRTRRGRLFTTASIKTIVTNPFYGPDEIVRYHYGEMDEKSRVTPPEKRIFPDDIHQLWQEAQEKRQIMVRSTGPKSASKVYPLHIVMRCSHCDSPYHGQTRRGQRASRHANPDAGCTKPLFVNSEMLEQQFVEALASVPIPADWQVQIQQLVSSAPREDRTGDRKRIEQSIERLRYQHLCGALDDGAFMRDFRTLRAELDSIPRTVVDAQTYLEPVRLWQSIGTIVGHPSLRLRDDAMTLLRRFCELAFERMDIEGSRIVRLRPRGHYRELFAIALTARAGIGAVERT